MCASSRSPGERASPDLAAVLRARIAAEGPIPVAEFMAAANAHYYATRDPLGAAGDFITAPEISQMFGELVGAWLADLWWRAGSPADAVYVEFGPGRGTLAVDALRVMAKAGLAPNVHFVETSPVLRAAQALRVPQAVLHKTIETLPVDAPLLIVANEFFDALPVCQFIATASGPRERLVSLDGAAFTAAADGEISESCPAALAITEAVAARLTRQGGAALIVDYGYEGPAVGDTLQALRAHAFADAFAEPGDRDLTAHVDFAALADTAQGVAVHGPIGQGAWLGRLGIRARAATLAAASPAQADEIEAARRRLSESSQMGALFKVMALVAHGWPQPAGFADD